MKKVFLKISQNSQENTCAKVSFLIKVQALVRHTLDTDTDKANAARYLKCV